MIYITPPKIPAVKLPSIHPLLWMARGFIAKVPLDELPKDKAETWRGYQKCALDAIEAAISLFQPVKPGPESIDLCMNQRIRIIIEPAEVSPHKLNAKK